MVEYALVAAIIAISVGTVVAVITLTRAVARNSELMNQTNRDMLAFFVAQCGNPALAAHIARTTPLSNEALAARNAAARADVMQVRDLAERLQQQHLGTTDAENKQRSGVIVSSAPSP